jgi:putative transposase
MSYESYLTDSDWELIEGIVYVGASAKIDRRELINAVFYIVKTGCQWRQLHKYHPYLIKLECKTKKIAI